MTKTPAAAGGLMDGAETPADMPVLRVQGPADMVHAIPYLLGFHPSRSLVVVGLAGTVSKRVVVTARADLDDFVDVTLMPRTVTGMVRGGAESFVGVVFDDDLSPGPFRGRLPWRDIATALHRAADDAGAGVDDVALVSRGRLWSYDCENVQCCPPEGRVVAVGTSPVAAAAAYAGMVALPDRASLGQLLQPREDPQQLAELFGRLEAAERDAVQTIVGGAQARLDRSDVRALFAAARSFDEPAADPTLGPDQLVRFGVALRRLAVRDAVWLGMDDGRIDGRRLWQRLATTLPAPFAAAPLFLFGWGTYRAGDGALAGIAAELALDNDPQYSAADLILAALSNAIDPRRLPKLRSHRQQPPRLRAGRREARRGGEARKDR